jgi:hypothetical protein
MTVPSNGYLRFPVKLFEVRDRGTFMPMMAVRLLVRQPDFRHAHDRSLSESQFAIHDNREEWLLRRAGYGQNEILDHADEHEPYVILIKLDGTECQYDPFAWPNRRTLTTAHLYIRDNWSKLTSGQVIDVEHILGESDQPKESEYTREDY